MNTLHTLIDLAAAHAHGAVSVADDTTISISGAGKLPRELTTASFLRLRRSDVEAASGAADAIDQLITLRPDDDAPLPPGVETFFHNELNHRFVIHVRDARLAGVLSGVNGREFVEKTFADSAMWLPLLPPGAAAVAAFREGIERFRHAHNGAEPRSVWIANYGVLVGGDAAETITAAIDEAISVVDAAITRRPETKETARDSDALAELNVAVQRALADTRAAHGLALSAPETTACANREVLRRTKSEEAFEPLRHAAMTDQIAPLGHMRCFAPRHGAITSLPALIADVLHAVHDYYADIDAAPRVVGIEGRGVVIVGETDDELHDACDAFERAIRAACYAESFGGSSAVPEAYLEAFRR